MMSVVFGLFACWAGGMDITLKETWADFNPEPEVWTDHILDLANVPERGLLILDGENKSVRWFEKKGSLKKTIGRKGEGPGELRKPMALWADKDRLLVYDAGKGAILRYDWDGGFQGQVAVERGTSAVFSRDYLVVQTLMRGARFRVFNHEGDELMDFGEDVSSIKNIMDRIKLIGMMTVDESQGRLNVFRASGLVQEVYDLQNGELIGEYDVSLDGYAKSGESGPKVKDGAVHINAKLPVKAVSMMNKWSMVLVQDEREQEKSVLMLFDDGGKQVGVKETPHFFRQMYVNGENTFFYDQEHGKLKVYQITISE